MSASPNNEPRLHNHDHEDLFDRGLSVDLDLLLGRRRVLKLLAGAGAAFVVAACGSSATDSGAPAEQSAAADSIDSIDSATTVTTLDSTSAAVAATSAGEADSSCPAVIPDETAGPYPGDGSNGPNVLSDRSVVRSDMRSSFGSFTGTAEGTKTDLTFRLLSANGCAPLAGAAVYAWHCDRDGNYSMYTAPDANYLRAVGETDASGSVTFTSIFPGCYDGRWPHIHFEVYPSVDEALSASNLLKTSQMALPQAACEDAYLAVGYETSLANLSRASLESDNVFSDGWDQELGTAGGDDISGRTLSLTVTV
jgi:protocatechuate 3,4-dioxygenase beta subunit